jgi:hypothetical protein
MALFKPGESGNPNGRPKGSKNFRARLFEQIATEHEPDIRDGVRRLFERVRNEDFEALKVMLEYFGCKARAPADDDDVGIESAGRTGLSDESIRLMTEIIINERKKLTQVEEEEVQEVSGGVEQ